MRSYRSKFIVLDGPDGCGKSTQCALLAEWLRGRGAEVVAVRDPGSTAIGERMRQILLDRAHEQMSMRCEMLLYMAARAQMMSQIILPALREQKTVVCDRFVSSTLAYQAGGEGMKADEIRAVAEVAIQGRWPDLTIILDLPAEQGLGRVTGEKDRIESRPMAYHQDVQRNYRALARDDPRRHVLVPATGTVEAVHASIIEAVLTRFGDG